jgi:adiponectin receptor
MGRSAEKQPQASSPTNNEAGNPTPFELEPYEKLPEWRQDNPYILASYRPISNSYLQSVKSLAYLHNQTGNIYTHLLFLIPVLGLVTYSSLMLYGFETSLVSPRNDDILAFSAFFGGAAACMALSTAYHTFANHSEAVALRGKQLDFAGILCLIWGSLMPTLFYTFPCEVGLMRAYMVVVCTDSFSLALPPTNTISSSRHLAP